MYNWTGGSLSPLFVKSEINIKFAVVSDNGMLTLFRKIYLRSQSNLHLRICRGALSH